MRILVCGGRDFDDFSKAEEVLDPYLEHRDELIIIQGGARGADRKAKSWAHMNYIPCVEHPANWPMNGKAAGPIRNQAMLDWWHPDLVIAFPGGRGTAHMVSIAKKAGIKTIEV